MGNIWYIRQEQSRPPFSVTVLFAIFLFTERNIPPIPEINVDIILERIRVLVQQCAATQVSESASRARRRDSQTAAVGGPG